MYQRYTPQAAPKYKPESLALVGGSIALVAVVLFVKSRKKGSKKRKRK